MNKQDMLVLYQYNAWSTAKILDTASNLTHEQFLAEVPFPYGSLRSTLVHAGYGEWVWRKRWEGNPRNPKWNPEDFPTLDSLRARWADEGTRLIDFVANVTDEQLHTRFKYVSSEGIPHERVVWEAMAHVITHGMQHKTEAAAILTGFGHSPGDIDLIVYLNERG